MFCKLANRSNGICYLDGLAKNLNLNVCESVIKLFCVFDKVFLKTCAKCQILTERLFSIARKVVDILHLHRLSRHFSPKLRLQSMKQMLTQKLAE